ncbi:GTPase SAR1 family protein [Paraburkholderia unamae]|uniref:dynamin family protein n=1 Tax=Paraburkholderia unamae TaxID=219649 RepID=UPI000DC26731|nr:dynamin family protein [Paraburkholderia unamae]RAR48676.1 GTPase SAR1 family protein [Paraburkholderia unamae]
MKADASQEQRFIAEVDAFEFVARDVEPILHALDAWLADLAGRLRDNALTCTGLKAQAEPATRADAINALMQASTQAWPRQWADLAPAQALADAFADKALLLVFGKFNAGKSSFCNFLADRFAAHGSAVDYFHLEAGRIVESPERFKEGATETTSRLQGVRPGDKLVLLDTPGLHSMTPENAALTQRFIDSADGVLWLTSSTSPGQVQELEDLGRELHRNKPLLPVLTRSDAYEEDEVNGELVKVLCNKSAHNRAQQEADVNARAREKLVAMGVNPALLKPPVSISAHVAREQGQTPVAMTEAGFERLYGALLDIIEPTLAYKRRKMAEILLHHLEENVLGVLCEAVLPRLAELGAASQAALDRLEQQEEEVANAVWRGVMPTLPGLLEKHSATRDVNAICNALTQSISETFSREANARLADYVITPDASLAPFSLDSDANFEDIVVDCTGADGPQREVVGVDYARLHAALGDAIQKHLRRLSRDSVEQCAAAIRRLVQAATQLEIALQSSERDLLDLKCKLRSDSIE